MANDRWVAGIVVPEWADARWPGWFAPEVQPFLVEALSGQDREVLPEPEPDRSDSMEIGDSFWSYGKRPRVWLNEERFLAIPRDVRNRLVRAQIGVHRSIGTVRRAPEAVRERARAQVDGHRFVWWPRLMPEVGIEPIVAMIDSATRTSRHLEVRDDVWERASALLPCAQALAGTFADRSGPNCFGTVMAAAGVPGAAFEWMMPDTFDNWLQDHTRRGGKDTDPGTILVWRDESQNPVHAAVTIGGGWALNKPSQGWFIPRYVWSVREVIYQSRYRGWHLERHTLLT